MISFAKFHPNFQRILLKIWQFLLRFRSRNLYKMFAQNAGNRISEVLDFKIFRGGNAPGPPYRCRVIRHPSRKTVDPPLYKGVETHIEEKRTQAITLQYSTANWYEGGTEFRCNY